MRFVYVDMHCNTFFMRSLRLIFTGQRAIDKHSFIIDWLLNNNIEVCDFVTIGGTSLPSSFIKKITKFCFLRVLEAKFVISCSKFPKGKIKVLSDYEKIKKDDIIIFYGHFPDTQFCFKNDTKGCRFGDLIHFYGDKRTSYLMRQQKIKHFISEINLYKYSGIFRNNYSWFNGDIILRKFSFQRRFVNITPFSQRKNKALAIGTLTYCDLEDFVTFYKTNVYQPIRKMIIDNIPFLRNEVDSYISYYQEIPRKTINDNDIFFVKLYKLIFNYFTNGKQKKYFSFDMVEKFNEYKMFVCPEDAVGQYGIGIIEGMACGCAMIGLKYGVYEELGFEDGKSYIAYDGTPEDLKKKINFYQSSNNQKILEEIASNGFNYVRQNFSQDSVAKEYFYKLKEIMENEQTIGN